MTWRGRGWWYVTPLFFLQSPEYPSHFYPNKKLQNSLPVHWLGLKNWCFQIVVLQKTLESPLDSKEIKPFDPKGNQPWIFIGRIPAEAPMLWPPDTKSQHIRKDPDVGKDWRQEKGVIDGEMVGWHHWLNEHEFKQALGDSEGQRSLACYSPWDRKELNTTEWLNNHHHHHRG